MFIGLVVIVNPLLAASSIATLAIDEGPAERRNTARMAALDSIGASRGESDVVMRLRP
ncbi:MAG TPA: hypothetical protein PLL04_08490 [Thauera sp.]|nr:hypothetical protein [Thauera sp.]